MYTVCTKDFYSKSIYASFGEFLTLIVKLFILFVYSVLIYSRFI